MKRGYFLKAVKLYQESIADRLVSKKVNKELAQEAVQTAVCKLLENQAYLKIQHNAVDARMYTYLRQASQYCLGHYFEAQKVESSRVASWANVVRFTGGSRVYRTEYLGVECPFCHRADLNKYGACQTCNTILGQQSMPVEEFKLDEIDLSVFSDYEQRYDIGKALNTLDEYEKKIALAVMNDSASLSELSCEEHRSKKTMHRTWLAIKEKLLDALSMYETTSSTRSAVPRKPAHSKTTYTPAA